MIDPVTIDVVVSLLVGTGSAIVVVLLLLGVRRLTRPRRRPEVHAPVEAVVPVRDDGEAAEPVPADEAEQPAAEVAGKPPSRHLAA